MKFTVIRKHGNFNVGDIREAIDHDVKHLIGSCLEPISEKSEKPKFNKAEKPMKNKAE